MEFSIIIPAKNEEKNIGNCLDSINAMDFEAGRFEVLVIDNGSSDSTVAIARAKGARVFEKPELTISGLRNFGAAQATGEVLAFLDADCTVNKNWLGAASFYLKTDEVVSFGSPAILPENPTWVQKAWFKIRGKKKQVEEVDWLESANVFVRREAFVTVGGFNEDLVTCEDYDLSVRLKKLGRILVDCRIVAVHHREPASIDEFFKKERWRGKSNLEGVLTHGFRWQELPSLAIPIVHCLFATLIFGYAFIGYLFLGMEIVAGLAVALAIWQIPLAFLAVWKTGNLRATKLAVQLFILLNVYFFARGLALFRGK